MLTILTALSLLAPVDVPVELTPVFDAFVQADHKDDQSAGKELKLGFNGKAVARSFLTFDTTQLAGKQIESAVLKLWNHHSWSCEARTWEVWAAEPTTTATRWPGPELTKLHAVSLQTLGYGDCADGYVEADVSALVQTWAGARAKQGSVGLRAGDETQEHGWKRFGASEDTEHGPVLSVTYG